MSNILEPLLQSCVWRIRLNSKKGLKFRTILTLLVQFRRSVQEAKPLRVRWLIYLNRSEGLHPYQV